MDPSLSEDTSMRRRRTRNPDKYVIGRSSLVPYIASEHWSQRHSRRKKNALDHLPEIQKWCREHQWSLRITNGGHQWTFTTHQKKLIEWWPSSGKIVIGKKWDEGIHCHDYKQLLELFGYTL